MMSNKKLTMLDSLRGLASIYVVCSHMFSTRFNIFGRDFSVLFRFGLEAVIIFFLLSGFVIQYSFEKSKDKSFKTYFVKRFARIYIPLLFVYIANYLIFILQKAPFDFGWKVVVGNIFMLQDLALPVKQNVICEPLFNNVPLWSLSYEWWFYMLFFLYSKKLKSSASNFVYLLSILSTISYLFYPFFLNRLFMYMAIWWIGTDLAKLYLHSNISFSRLKKQYCTLLVCTALLLVNFLYYGHGLASLRSGGIAFSPFIELRNFSFATIALSIALIWKKFQWVGFSKTVGLFLPLAPISFGIYISHWFLIIEGHYLDNLISNFYLRYTAYFIICLLFSYLIERVLYVNINRKLIARIR